MHLILPNLLLLLGFSAATPLPDVAAFSAPGGLSRGFPPQYLPPSFSASGIPNYSGNSTSSLLLPLNRSGDPGGNLLLPMDIKDYWDQPSFETRVVTDAARPPKGGQLVASIIHEIYGCWKNIPNAPIMQQTEARVAPFQDILHTIQPALLPGAALTPFKVGLVYCWMLRSVWLAQTWPGHITASVYNAQAKGKLGLPLGVVYVKNSPQRIATRLTTPNHNTIMSSSSPNVTTRIVTNPSSDTNDQLSVLQDRPIPEKSWLECFSMIMFVIFGHPWSDRVTDTYPPGRHIFHWVSTLDKAIEGTLAIYYDAGAAYTNQLTWDHLAKATLSLGNEAAAADSWDGNVQVSIDAKLVAEISIGRAVAADDGAVTT